MKSPPGKPKKEIPKWQNRGAFACFGSFHSKLEVVTAPLMIVLFHFRPLLLYKFSAWTLSLLQVKVTRFEEPKGLALI